MYEHNEEDRDISINIITYDLLFDFLVNKNLPLNSYCIISMHNTISNRAQVKLYIVSD